nr:hypothetical protein [Tanacetum cinerariifolium]
MFDKQTRVKQFDLIQTFHACKQEEGKSVSLYVLKMKGYVEQLEHLGFVLPQGISVGLILNGLTGNFAGFLKNYNMHSMRKTIGELHALLIEYEKGLPKKAATPQVMAIQGGRIQKANKKSLNAKEKGISVGLIFNGLTGNFAGFLKNYNMHSMGKTIGELHALLIEYEKGLPKKAATPQVMAIQDGRIRKANKKSLNAKEKGKRKGKGKDKSYIPKPKNPKPSAKEHPAKDGACHHCKEVGHCKRNCHAYLAELIKKKKQGLKGERKLKQEALYLFMGNDVHAQAEAIGSYDLVLSSGLVIFLDNFHYAPSITRDRGGEYISQKFKDYPKAYGIVQKLTPPYTPQLSGMSQRRNRTLLDMVRLLMNLTTLSLSFWDYALETATRILNMVPTKKVDKTPYGLWYEKVPNLSYLKVWGCEALVKRDTPDKLQQRSVKCIFIRYPKETMEINGRAEELEEIQDEDTSPSENTSEIPMVVECFKPPQEEVVPIHPKSDKWFDAMNAEMKSMKDNQVWRLVDLPPNPRLVAKDYTQTYGVDYEETFSPVADIGAIRILIAIAAFYDYRYSKRMFKIDNFKRGNIHMQERFELNKTQGPSTPEEVKRMQNVPYDSAVGKPHWTAVKTILKYLRNTKDMLLVYGGNTETKLRVDCYCNARFETDRDDIKTQTGYVSVLNRDAVVWKSSKQSTTAMSAT